MQPPPCGLLVLITLLTGAAPILNVTFALVNGLPFTMKVGDISYWKFDYAQMLSNFFFPEGVLYSFKVETMQGLL